MTKYRYSPLPLSDYMCGGLGPKTILQVKEFDEGDALWNYIWLGMPSVDVLPGAGQDWHLKFTTQHDLIVGIYSSFYANETLQCMLERHPKEFLAWFLQNDLNDNEAFKVGGLDWKAHVETRCAAAISRLVSDASPISNVVKIAAPNGLQLEVNSQRPFVVRGKHIAAINPVIFQIEVIKRMNQSSSLGNRQAERDALQAFDDAWIRTRLGQSPVDKEHQSHMSSERSIWGTDIAQQMGELKYSPHIVDIVCDNEFLAWVKTQLHPIKDRESGPINERRMYRFLARIASHVASARHQVICNDDTLTSEAHALKKMNIYDPSLDDWNKLIDIYQRLSKHPFGHFE